MPVTPTRNSASFTACNRSGRTTVTMYFMDGKCQRTRARPSEKRGSFATNKNKFPGTLVLARLERRPYRHDPALMPGRSLLSSLTMIIARSRLISLVLFTAILLAVLGAFGSQAT
jgi:hypothetical protein